MHDDLNQQQRLDIDHEPQDQPLQNFVLCSLAAVLLLAGSVFWFNWRLTRGKSKKITSDESRRSDQRKSPVSVNYHFTRKCNYECGFCFHTAKSSFVLKLDEAKHGLALLQQAGMRKLNLAGGEPLLRAYRPFVGELIRHAKEELGLESVSIVSNGSQLDEEWFDRYGAYIDILAISCDSFDERVNADIGRGRGDHLAGVRKARDLCLKHKIKFKINTVVNRLNWEEDMNQHICELQPSRWKCFQVLKIEGENAATTDDSGYSSEDQPRTPLRDVSRFIITDEQFDAFCARHRDRACFVPESNKAMKDSYLLLDERMRFLNCTANRKDPTGSILEVGVQQALDESGWDDAMFVHRGGLYDWTRSPGSCGSLTKELEW